MRTICFTLVMWCLMIVMQSCSSSNNVDCELDIYPTPTFCEQFQGDFKINTNTQIVVKEFTPSNMFYAKLLHDAIQDKTGHILGVIEEYQGRSKNCIIIEESEDAKLGKAGFEIYISPNSIRLKARGDEGYFNAVQTLIQIVNDLEKDGSFPCLYMMDMWNRQVGESMIDLAGGVSLDSVLNHVDVMVSKRQGRLLIKNADSAGFDVARLKEVKSKGERYFIEVVNY